MTKEDRKPKSECRGRRGPVSVLGIRASSFLRHWWGLGGAFVIPRVIPDAGRVGRRRAAVGGRGPQLPRPATRRHDGPADQGRTRDRRRPVRAVLLHVPVGVRALLAAGGLPRRSRRPQTG